MSGAFDLNQSAPRIREAAEISTARGCGFAGLATICLMVGLASKISNVFKGGGFCALLVCLVLLLMAHQAPSTRARATEIWLMLAPQDRPPDALAQGIIGRIRRATFLRFATYHAIAAAVLLGVGFLVTLGGF
ncbi:MAG: hypothetical protein ACRDBH_00435 [Bosea sp. (in: a-proteobacteria)]